MLQAFSSTALRKVPLPEVIKLAKEHNLILEFSSGLPYSPQLISFFEKADCQKLLHNYFPAPEVPFVLNIASLDKNILFKSIEHVKSNIERAALTDLKYFSLHAGYCLDPHQSELGKSLNIRQLENRDLYWKTFIETLDYLLNYAQKHNVCLCVENNVVSPENFRAYQGNPLLCADPEEILKLANHYASHPHFALLLDTAHWKVSSVTLGFDIAKTLPEILSHVKIYHHSDNNGLNDSNHNFDENYWFLPFMPNATPDAIHVLEIHDQNITEIKNLFHILSKACPHSDLNHSR